MGEVKTIGHREATEAHLALPMGERLIRGAQLSDSMLRLHREAGQGGLRAKLSDDEADTWRRVNEHLKSLGRSDRPHHG